MPIYSVSSQNLARAVEYLHAGELVAFPTETVYGLGAHALDENAVAKIYAAKGRPAYNPLIVHVPDIESARQIVVWNERAQTLAEKFWPGPLTLVLPKQAAVPYSVSAGLATVAVRVPAHPVARQLLEQAQIPIAAPSANRSTEISPTLAQHVEKSLGPDIFILDGGACEVGLESTVLDLSGGQAAILRPGGLVARDIEAVIGPLGTASEVENEAPRPSPGMMERHYAPRARVQLFVTSIDAFFYANLLGHNKKIGRLLLTPLKMDGFEIVMPTDPGAYGQRLYAALHELDNAGVELILVEDVPPHPSWDAIRDRLKRAATP